MVFGPPGYRQDLLQPKQNRLGGKRHQQRIKFDPPAKLNPKISTKTNQQ